MELYLGKEVKRVKVPYTITRETSKYNKYMKWHLTFYREDGTVLSSEWYKTEMGSKGCIERMIKEGPFPIGNKYQILEPAKREVNHGTETS